MFLVDLDELGKRWQLVKVRLYIYILNVNLTL